MSRHLLPHMTLAALLAAAAGSPCAGSDPAYFWISESGVTPSGPEAPTINRVAGDTDTLYIWARPATGKRLRNVSLNLIADRTGVDFADGGFSVFDTISGPVDRFEFHKDSSTSPALTSVWGFQDVIGGQIDALYDIQGFTLIADPDHRGIGPACLPGDANCHMATDGQPAWLFAEIDIRATSVGTVNLNLQIGNSGIVHETISEGDYNFDGAVDIDDFSLWKSDFGSTTLLNSDASDNDLVDAADFSLWRDNLGSGSTVETAAMTDVVFGIDTIDGVPEPEHNAGPPPTGHRNTNLSMDDPDAVIVISAPPLTQPATGQPATGAPEPASVVLAVALGGLAVLRRANQQTRG